MATIEEIGFLNVQSNFEFEGGSLKLSPGFNKAKRWIDRHANDDGYVYPPSSFVVKIDLTTRKETRLRSTTRPALLHRMPTSHELILREGKNIQKSRLGLAGFVTQCFGFLFGTRLQFSDWWLEGRIPIASTTNVHSNLQTAEMFISKAISSWKQFDRKRRLIVSNLLYLFCKSGSLEWDWERFQMEYTVFDACYAMMAGPQFRRFIPHNQRFEDTCRYYGLRHNKGLFLKFVELRNQLIHEALWDGGQINTARSSASFMASYHLRRLNHRLITATLTGRTSYTSTPWWLMGTFAFRL